MFFPTSSLFTLCITLRYVHVHGSLGVVRYGTFVYFWRNATQLPYFVQVVKLN